MHFLFILFLFYFIFPIEETTSWDLSLFFPIAVHVCNADV